MATGGGKAGAGKKRPTGIVVAVYDTCPSFSARAGFVNELICSDFPVFIWNDGGIDFEDFLARLHILWSSRKSPPQVVGRHRRRVYQYSAPKVVMMAESSAVPAPTGN